MRRFVVAQLIAVWPVLAMAALPTTVSYQGILKSPGGVVVDATQSIRFTLYDQPTGGTPLWTETQLVTVEEGLFSVELGSVTPFGDIWSSHAAYYVETEVFAPGGYQVVVPRTHLISTPFALESASLHGDVETDPSKLKIEFGTGLPTTSVGDVELSSSSSGSGLTFMDSSKVTGGIAKGIIKGGVGGGGGTVNMTLDVDADGDGVPVFIAQTVVDDGDARSSVTADLDEDGDPDMGSTVVAETYDGGPGMGTSEQAIESRLILTSYFQPGATPSSESKKVDTVDGSGVHSTVRALMVNNEGYRDYLCAPDSVVDVTVVTDGPSSSSSSMRTRINELEAKLQAFGLLARSTVTTSLGDGTTVTMEDSSTTTGAKAKGIITVKAGSGSTGGASQSLTLDVDGDGIPDVGTEWTAIKDRTELKSEFQVGDIPTETDFTRTLDSSGGHVSLVSADLTGDGRSDLRCSPDSVMELVESSTSGASARGIITVKASSGGTGSSSHRLSVDHDGNGTDDESVNMSCDEHGSKVTTTSPSGSAHVQCWDGSCRILLTDATMGSEDTSIVIDATAKRFGIGVTEPAYPIHHSSGAHLSAAGEWANASDIHLKENFKQVDREKLLDQIEKLNITQWNYRNQSADVTHIGPTAQEFKQVFGVGEDDKTISTIDPSGIALAAIQELTRQNRELREQLEELKNRLENIEAR